VGQPKGQSPFYSALAPDNLADSTQIYLFTPTITLHNGKFSKGRACLLQGHVSVWAIRGSSEARFSPDKELVVCSALLGNRTALTDEGLLLGKVVFGTFFNRLGCWFRPTRGFGFTEEAGNGVLMITLMLLELCGFCCAGTAQPSGAGLRCRERGRMPFGAEGVEELKPPRDGCASTRGRRRSGQDVPEAR
jgi:hypothetical protein